FDAHAVLLRVRGAKRTLEFAAVRGLAYVGGAQIEGTVGRIHLDGVKEFSAEHFDARDVSVAQRREFLHEHRVVHAKVEHAIARRIGELFRRVKAENTRAAPADVRLHENRKAKPLRRSWRLRRIVDDSRTGVGKAELLQDVELEG